MAATRFVCCPVMAMIAAAEPFVAPIASRASAVVPPGVEDEDGVDMEEEEEEEEDAVPLPNPGLSLVPRIVNCLPLPPLQRVFRNHDDARAKSINSRGTC